MLADYYLLKANHREASSEAASFQCWFIFINFKTDQRRNETPAIKLLFMTPGGFRATSATLLVLERTLCPQVEQE